MRNLRGGVFLLVMTTCWQTAVAGQETESFFKLRGRVLSSGGASVATNDFKFTLAGSNVWSRGTNWSEWIRRPCFNQSTTPGILRLDLSGGHDPCVAQLQTQIEGLDGVRTFDGKLYGSHWGLLHWQWEGRPYVTTMAEYNRMAWNLITVTNPSARIEHFPVAERYISGDNDRIALQEGIAGLTGVGFSALMIDGGKFGREYLLQAGLRRTAAAVYCPPGGPFDYGLADPHAALSKWAGDILKPLTNAGFASTDLALLAMADEPGWYYPACLRQLTNNPVALGRFRDYLKSQKLTPAELGAGSWSEVWPKGRSQAGDLPARRLFYWTMRFFPWDSARYSAQCTRALESAFYTNMPVFVNWNFFSGRSYVPGGVANNRDKSSPDAAMGGHDWMEFGRLRGSTMLWTEDWFGDELAYQWSYYSARLNSAARRGGVEFGGYIVPRSSGSRAEGLLQKAAAILGHGGKAIQYFVFGPEYLFPGNCYSRNPGLLVPIAKAHRLIAKAEPLLWPGRPLAAQVAILMPRSAQFWDQNGISDATNFRLNNQTVDYMAEVYNIFLAFMHANIQVDFVEEEQLNHEGLQGVKVLYVTEPNVPEEYQKQLVDWVKGGGTLVTVSGAAQRDRYNEPCRILSKGLGIFEKDRERVMLGNLYALQGNGSVTGAVGNSFVIGPRGTLENEKALNVEARFENGAAALISKQVSKGRAVHFNWMPGLVYGQSPQHLKGMLVNWPAAPRELILSPARQAGVRAVVRPDRPMVEAPLLTSSAGTVVTLLNWTDEPVTNLTVEMDWSPPVKSVESVIHGALGFEQREGVLKWSAPLNGADFILIRH